MRRSAHNSLGLLLIFLIVTLIPAWGQNPVVVENQNAGSTNWNLGNSGSDAVGQIKGYASAASINKGESITFFVSVNPAQTFTIDVYRLGWYGGAGGRQRSTLTLFRERSRQRARLIRPWELSFATGTQVSPSLCLAHGPAEYLWLS